MEQKFFLEKNRHKFSNNVEGAINMALSTKTRLLPNNDALDDFSLFEQYNRERDTCNKYRIMLNINPICSNVLFNARTEIVIDEGSPNCRLLIGKNPIKKEEYAINAVNSKEDIDWLHAIRNTEYSHKENGGFVYHCGFDIFNNHMLRKKGFVHVNKINNNSSKYSELYNTIFDYLRDSDGDIITEDLCVKYDNSEKTSMHLYQYDTIMSMPVAFMDNCIEKDGWWGFTNPNTIEITNNSGNSISINRMFSNNKACEFIDFYPDRSLYKFTPIFNKKRNRIEKNWDYCLTYPYKRDGEIINKVCGGEEGAIKSNIKLVYNGNGSMLVEVSSFFKHNLKPGDYVTFYYYQADYIKPKHSENYPQESDLSYVKTENGEFLYLTSDLDEFGNIKSDEFGNNPEHINKVVMKKFKPFSQKVKVVSLGTLNGDFTDRIFKVKFEDIEYVYESMRFFGCFYKKNSGGSDCLYYARKFKKFKSIDGSDLKSEINKVAFGTNIYGDNISQIIFLDDLNIDGMVDHNNRPLSEIYLTVLKRNAGRKEWYEDGDYGNNSVEVSHCFGKVTSGIDFCGIDNEPFDYNIHYLHNIEAPTIGNTKPISNTLSAWGDTLLFGKPKVIEDNININNEEFYGDIVEYNPLTAEETVIANIYHRFNTAQREIFNTDFRDIIHDEIVNDDYDVANGGGGSFTCKTYYSNNVKNPLDDKGKFENLMYGNIFPEGYFYNPHTKIQLRENDYMALSSAAKNINYRNILINNFNTYLLVKENGEIEVYNTKIEAQVNQGDNDVIIPNNSYYEFIFTSPVNYGFYKGDFIAFYDTISHDVVWGEITNVESATTITVKIEKDSFIMIDGDINEKMFSPLSGKRRFYAYWSPDNVPTYAKLYIGGRKFVWKKLIEPSNVLHDGVTYNTPFSNGCFYIEKNINFFLKRQDPSGKYGLSKPLYRINKPTISYPLNRYIMKGKTPIDFSDVLYTLNNLDNDCSDGTY